MIQRILFGRFAPLINLSLLLLIIPIVLISKVNVYALIIGMIIPCVHYAFWGMKEGEIPNDEEVVS